MFNGETLRLLRTWKKLKQQSIADKLGITQQAYSKLENKKAIRKEKVKEILEALNCSEADLKVFEKLPT